MKTGQEDVMTKNKYKNGIYSLLIPDKDVGDLINSNPFLFDANKSLDTIYVVEDFYVKYNDNYVKFEDVVRTEKISKHDKRKIISNQIAIWEQEAEEEIYKVFNDSRETIMKCRKNKLKKFSFLYYFLLSIGIIIAVLCFFKVIPPISFIGEYYKLFALILTSISVIGFILALTRARLQIKFTNVFAKHKRTHERLNREIFRKLSKNAKLIKKYYTKNFEEKKYTKDPLEIEKVDYVYKKLTAFQSSMLKVNQLNNKLKNKSSKFSIGQQIAIILSYITSSVGVLYIIVSLIVYIIESL